MRGNLVAPVTPPEEGDAQLELRREFGRRLREAREKRWPRPLQREWAEQMGLTDVRQYQRWEHGEQLPAMERLPKIIEVSGIDITDLIEPPSGLTRDGIKEYFDQRIEAMTTLLQANQALIQEMIEELDDLNHNILDRVESIERRLGMDSVPDSERR